GRSMWSVDRSSANLRLGRSTQRTAAPRERSLASACRWRGGRPWMQPDGWHSLRFDWPQANGIYGDTGRTKPAPRTTETVQMVLDFRFPAPACRVRTLMRAPDREAFSWKSRFGRFDAQSQPGSS